MVVLTKGDRSEDVRRLQRLLNSALKPGPGLAEDGGFGDKTQAAVVRFQRARGLKHDGVVGPKTWTALGQKMAVTPKPKHKWVRPTPAPVRKDWMEIARLEAGVSQNTLPGQDNAKIVEYHAVTSFQAGNDETPWCSSFVNWVLLKAGYKPTYSAAAKDWLKWGAAQTDPREGAITVIYNKLKNKAKGTTTASGFHVGFYVSSTKTHIRLFGGNQGRQVREAGFNLEHWEVKGYRWPH